MSAERDHTGYAMAATDVGARETLLECRDQRTGGYGICTKPEPNPEDSRREEGRVPPPGRDDNGESADERGP